MVTFNWKISVIQGGRAGSTLLGKMTQAAGARTISESIPLMNAHGLYISGTVSYNEYEKIFRSIFRIETRKRPDETSTHLVLKTPSNQLIN